MYVNFQTQDKHMSSPVHRHGAPPYLLGVGYPANQLFASALSKIANPAALTTSASVTASVDDYAKNGGPGAVYLDVVFTMILCANSFFIWKAMKLKFTN